ncbi:MAG TPA: hypothetical protein VLJ10_04300 [Candidatus Bathyarchaeia archaeon]|nr:hypothetical protein [Candidatus Bathyarchaeia archaeon]
MKGLEKDIEFEIEFYEGLLRHNPDFEAALIALGDTYTRAGFYEEGLSIDQRLARLRPEDPVVLYNLACSFSLLNQPDKAFTAIKQALALGYEELEYLQMDDDLKELRAWPAFKEYFEPLLRAYLKERAVELEQRKIFRDQ